MGQGNYPARTAHSNNRRGGSLVAALFRATIKVAPTERVRRMSLRAAGEAISASAGWRLLRRYASRNDRLGSYGARSIAD